MYVTSCILKKHRQRVYKRFISWINFEIYNEVYNEDQLPLRRMRGYCYIVVKKLISCFLKSRLTVSQNFNTKERFGLVSCKLGIAKYYSKIIRTTFTIITSEVLFSMRFSWVLDCLLGFGFAGLLMYPVLHFQIRNHLE